MFLGDPTSMQSFFTLIKLPILALCLNPITMKHANGIIHSINLSNRNQNVFSACFGFRYRYDSLILSKKYPVRSNSKLETNDPDPENAMNIQSIGGRFFLYEFFTEILPSRNVKTSHPFTSTFLPSRLVPVKVHSDTPRLPTIKCLAPRH